MAMPVEVIRSKRRRKTVQAVVVDGVIRVHVPAHMSADDEAAYVAELVERLERRYRSDHIDLDERSRSLARRYRLPMPTTVRWADNQRRRWGSCTPATGEIRISTRLADYPAWVLDYVLVHELAHLEVADHSAAFHAIVDRYHLAERARGFLIAKSFGDDSERDDTERDDAPGDGDRLDDRERGDADGPDGHRPGTGPSWEGDIPWDDDEPWDHEERWGDEESWDDVPHGDDVDDTDDEWDTELWAPSDSDADRPADDGPGEQGTLFDDA